MDSTYVGKKVKFVDKFGKEITVKVRSEFKGKNGKIEHVNVLNSQKGYEQLPVKNLTIVK